MDIYCQCACLLHLFHISVARDPSLGLIALIVSGLDQFGIVLCIDVFLTISICRFLYVQIYFARRFCMLILAFDLGVSCSFLLIVNSNFQLHTIVLVFFIC